jgi:hypothetical protein
MRCVVRISHDANRIPQFRMAMRMTHGMRITRFALNAHYVMRRKCALRIAMRIRGIRLTSCVMRIA